MGSIGFPLTGLCYGFQSDEQLSLRYAAQRGGVVRVLTLFFPQPGGKILLFVY